MIVRHKPNCFVSYPLIENFQRAEALHNKTCGFCIPCTVPWAPQPGYPSGEDAVKKYCFALSAIWVLQCGKQERGYKSLLKQAPYCTCCLVSRMHLMRVAPGFIHVFPKCRRYRWCLCHKCISPGIKTEHDEQQNGESPECRTTITKEGKGDPDNREKSHGHTYIDGKVKKKDG